MPPGSLVLPVSNLEGWKPVDSMVMDPSVRELSGMISGFNFRDCVSGAAGLNAFRPDNSCNIFTQHNLVDPPILLPSASNGYAIPPASGGREVESSEDSEIFSDIALTYISNMLMEEMDDKADMCQGNSALQAAEKPFYDILYPPSLDQPPLYADHFGSPDDSINGHYGSSVSCGRHGVLVESSCLFDLEDHSSSEVGDVSANSSSQNSFSFTNSANSSLCVKGSLLVAESGNNMLTEIHPVWQFKRGVEEASKFLPDQNKLIIDLQAHNFQLPNGGFVRVKEEKEDKGYLHSGLKNRKNREAEDLDLKEGRSVKQSAVFSEDEVRSDMFDEVLLCHCGKSNDVVSTLRRTLQDEVSKSSKGSQNKGSTGGKSRGKRQAKKEVVDLRTLLIQCAQAVAADDRRTAVELLKQIRQHSSPHGDGSQRLARCFADGLEARLAGTGSQIYHSFMSKRQSAAAILKAYHLYLAACPFKKISHFFANQTILNAAENAKKLHIIDFGIYFGFQWPCLIQRLSLRPQGALKLRITGIDVPQPGFRPNERIEQTGRRLAEYAKMFNVDFEYHPIASKWEDVNVEELKIDKDEVVVVNCLYRFRNLVDETVVEDSPRNIVLNNIRKMNPDVFIHGIVNGAFSAPFFITRFREALFHFSALFDMLETTVPREHPERSLIEAEIFARDAINVIACEGPERVERPETYKQWQARNLRAGFAQLPLDPDITKRSRDKVRSTYNKDFVIDEDSRWLLQGWKGRIIYAISTWRPNRVAL